jgi:hypothetical protein
VKFDVTDVCQICRKYLSLFKIGKNIGTTCKSQVITVERDTCSSKIKGTTIIKIKDFWISMAKISIFKLWSDTSNSTIQRITLNRERFWLLVFCSVYCWQSETAVAQWLRYCATNQKVAGSIPDGVMEIFIDINPSDRTMALGSTQPLTEMSTRYISWGKCGRCVRLTTLPPSCAVVKKSGNFNFLEHSGPLQACNGTALPLLLTVNEIDFIHSSLPLVVNSLTFPL